MVNDVTALRGDEEMVKALAGYGIPVVLMYSKDRSARTSKEKVRYDDVVNTIHGFFEERIDFALKNGLKKENLVLDPGMGAFVSMEAKYSLQILRRLKELDDFGLPILAGPSRKSFIGEVLNLKVEDRLEGSLAASAVAVMNGANILRVHDVKQTRRVVDMVHAIMNS
jgi:dihydropteroate synthase